MCNEVARRLALGLLREDISDLRIPLRFPEGAPNFGDTDSIKITDPTPILRWGEAGAECVTRRWSWPGQGGKPVYNYRSDGRDLTQRRCLIPVTGFYEFTAPAELGKKRKDKWLFTVAGQEWFCIAGLWRSDAKVGEAFTMLTTEPGPDIAPYHARQVVVPARDEWAGWLDGSLASREVCRPAAAGMLSVRQVG